MIIWSKANVKTIDEEKKYCAAEVALTYRLAPPPP